MSPRDAENARKKELAEFGWNRDEEDVGVLKQGNVHLVSCKSGKGMNELMESVISMANEYGSKVFVMGAANVGKSSFINQLLTDTYKSNPNKGRGGKKRLARTGGLLPIRLLVVRIQEPFCR